MTKRTHRQRFWPWWPASKRPCSTTDDITPTTEAYFNDARPRLLRPATDPSSTDSRLSPISVSSPASPLPPPDTMPSATITFSQAGVEPPVYVVTSLSGWTTLEMSVASERTASGDLVFTKEFADAAEGSHQYKIRVGEHHWVLDLSKESDAEEHGYRNNVVHVKPAMKVESSIRATDTSSTTAATTNSPEDQQAKKSSDDGKVDSDSSPQLPAVPVPLVVVEKVADTEQPAYGDIDTVRLPSDDAKRAADAEPDFEEIKSDPATATDKEPPKSPEIPLLVVEKTDDKPAYGEDFGKDATPAQKVAHNMRTADASPDRLVISPEQRTGPDSTVEQPAPLPLFSHESFQADKQPSIQSTDTIEEESVQSSTDQTSSGDPLDTPSETDDTLDRDEVDQEPQHEHKTDSSNKNGDFRDGPLLPHEAQTKTRDEAPTSDDAPRFPHEDSTSSGNKYASDEEDEYDRAPLLSHETDDSDYKNSEITTDSGYKVDDENKEPQHYGPDGDDDDLDDDNDEAPLLPHERGSGPASKAGSEQSADDDHFTLYNQPTFDYENDNAGGSHKRTGRPGVFRVRTNSSTLPHKLPRSDADDENLHDASLEQFPIDREQIMLRVASIRSQLPEDESVEDQLHSPQFSVFSQACSSVDLVPVKSYTSLASVPEADYSDDEVADGDSLPSPIFIGGSSQGAYPGLPRDVQAVQDRKDGDGLDYAEEVRPEAESTHHTDSAQSESADKKEGTEDTSPGQKNTSDSHSVASLDSQLRERRRLNEDSTTPSHDSDDSIVSSNKVLITSTSTSVVVLGVAIVAYYFFKA